MMNLFRRHRAACRSYGRRTGAKCPSKPPCPIYYEGTDGAGHKQKPQALIDPLTKVPVFDLERACALLAEQERPVAAIVAGERAATIQAAIESFLQTKQGKSPSLFRASRRVVQLFQDFMEAPPRGYKFLSQVGFADLTELCSTWVVSNRSKLNDLGALTSFLRYCHRADLTPKYLGEGLFKTLRWQAAAVPREPFSREELERLWEVLPRFKETYKGAGPQTGDQVEAFVYVMRYTGMDLSTTMTLRKTDVVGNRILTHRLKNGSEVWTVIPEWVAEKLWTVHHESEAYFFWTGKGIATYGSSTWQVRLRKLLDMAGLKHRTTHNFRHHFAVEHLLNGTPIEDVSRLLGHNDVQVTLKCYAAWVKKRQERLEYHQQRVWENDPLCQRMKDT